MADPNAAPPDTVTQTVVDNATGKSVDMPAAGVVDAFKSGAVSLIPGSKIPVFEGGATKWVPAESAQEYLDTTGAIDPTARDVAENVYGGRGTEAFLESAAVGALDTASLGLVNGRNLVTQAKRGWSGQSQRDAENESRALLMHNQDAAGWGKFTGMAAGALGAGLLTGGYGGLAGGASLAGRVGVAALEGGVAGLSSAREEAWIRDEELSASAAFGHVATGALLGAGAGYGMNLAGRAVSSAARSAREAAQDAAVGFVGAAKGAAGAAAEAAGTEGGTLTQILERKAQSTLQKLGLEESEARILSTAEGRALATGHSRNLDKLSREMTAAINDVVTTGNGVESVQLMKPALVKSLVDPARAQIQRESIGQVTAGVDSAVSEVLSNASQLRLSTGDKNLLKDIQGQVARVVQGADSLSSEELYVAQDSVKRSLQKQVLSIRERGNYYKSRGEVATADAMREAANSLEAVQQRQLNHLVDPEVWGDRLANYQRQVNAGWEDVLESSARIREKFQRQGNVDYSTGRRATFADSAKVDSYVRSAGNVAADDTNDALRNWINGQKNILKAAEDAGAHEHPAIVQSKAAIDRIEKIQADITLHAEAQRALTAAEEAGSKSGLAAALKMVPMVGHGASEMVNPASLVKSLAFVEKATSKFSSQINAAANAATGGAGVGAVAGKAKDLAEVAAGTIARGATSAGTAAGRVGSVITRLEIGNLTGVSDTMHRKAIEAATVGGVAAQYWRGGKNSQEAYAERAKEVAAMAAQGAAQGHAARLLGEMGRDAPRFSGAFSGQMARAAGFLESKLPSPPSRVGELQGAKKLPAVDQAAIEKFGRYWTAVTSPTACLELLERGQLRPEHVEALEAVHPRVLQRIQDSVIERVEAADRPIPQAKLRGLDILLKLDGRADPSVSQQALRIMAAAGQQAHPQQPKPQATPNIAAKFQPRSAGLARM